MRLTAACRTRVLRSCRWRVRLCLPGVSAAKSQALPLNTWRANSRGETTRESSGAVSCRTGPAGPSVPVGPGHSAAPASAQGRFAAPVLPLCRLTGRLWGAAPSPLPSVRVVPGLSPRRTWPVGVSLLSWALALGPPGSCRCWGRPRCGRGLSRPGSGPPSRAPSSSPPPPGVPGLRRISPARPGTSRGSPCGGGVLRSQEGALGVPTAPGASVPPGPLRDRAGSWPGHPSPQQRSFPPRQSALRSDEFALRPDPSPPFPSRNRPPQLRAGWPGCPHGAAGHLRPLQRCWPAGAAPGGRCPHSLCLSLRVSGRTAASPASGVAPGPRLRQRGRATGPSCSRALAPGHCGSTATPPPVWVGSQPCRRRAGRCPPLAQTPWSPRSPQPRHPSSLCGLRRGAGL